jgi:surface polysaccharide O-acyltransferase-like enzyme
MASRLLTLNGVAILGVILFHATGFGFTAMFSWAHRYRPVMSPNYDEIGTLTYYALRLVEQFVVFSIPAFLFVSGFFVSVLAGRRARVDPRAIVARIRSLLPPYLLWSLVVLAAAAVQGRILPPARYVALIATGATGPNYYYVPLLIQLYLVAPVIVLLAKWNWKVLLAVTATLHVVVCLLQYVVVLGLDIPVLTTVAIALPKWLFVVHVFWFTLGAVVGFEQPLFRSFLTDTRWVWPACAICLLILGVAEWELLLRWSGSAWRENRVTLIDGLYAASFIFTFLAFADVRLPFSQLLASLGGKSFGIYLIHGLAMDYVARSLYHVAPWILGRQLLFQPIILVAGLLVPLLLMEAVRRSPVRSVYAYVFG